MLGLPAAWIIFCVRQLRKYGRLKPKARALQALRLPELPRFAAAVAPKQITTGACGVPEGCKVIYFVRHGQAIHNAAAAAYNKNGRDEEDHPYFDSRMTDAPLTDDGRQQARALLNEEMSQVECAICSPLVRAVETACIGLTSHLARGLSLVVIEECREQFGKNLCDKRGLTSSAAVAFPQADFSRIVDEEDPLFTDEREPLADMALRADRFLERLSRRSEKHIAVVTHSSFLCAIFNAAIDCRRSPELRRWFHYAEMRPVLLSRTTPTCTQTGLRFRFAASWFHHASQR